MSQQPIDIDTLLKTLALLEARVSTLETQIASIKRCEWYRKDKKEECGGIVVGYDTFCYNHQPHIQEDY
jgi:hypothetical protein